MLVLQFYYPKPSSCGSPTLFVYNMTENHVATGTPPEVLSYGEASKEPLTGRNQVLGDQKIKISTIEKLIERVKGNKRSSFSYLVFTPIYMSDNPHIGYKVSVDDSSVYRTSNPSPPG